METTMSTACLSRRSKPIFWVKSCFVILIAVLLSQQTFALSDEEITALTAIRNSFGSIPSGWTSLPSSACSSWTGVGCDLDKTTVISIVLENQPSVGGSISPAIATLTNLTTVILKGLSLTGTIPEISSLTSLDELNLEDNRLLVCESIPTLPTSLGSGVCSIAGQLPIPGACGCASDWAANDCTNNIAACPACPGNPPREESSAYYCLNGRWTRSTPYSGQLSVRGPTTLPGDYTLEFRNILTFESLEATLNVTGTATIRGPVNFVLTRADNDFVRRRSSTFLRYYHVYMFTGSDTSTRSSLISTTAQTYKSCWKLYTSSSGQSTREYEVSIRVANTCNTWWILLLSIGMPFVVTGLIVAIVFACV